MDIDGLGGRQRGPGRAPHVPHELLATHDGPRVHHEAVQQPELHPGATNLDTTTPDLPGPRVDADTVHVECLELFGRELPARSAMSVRLFDVVGLVHGDRT